MVQQPKRLGDLEIVREIGRGGMGVVYEAVQLSLNRRVALKVLPPGTTPEQRDIERFQREARAAASLDHPNIVPIYAQGDEEGTHYYAMRLVQGRSLDQIIHDVRGIDLPACTSTELVRTITADSQATIALEERPTVPLEEGAPEEAPPERRPTDLSSKYFRTAARLIMEVAQGLEYAHSQGVIHRDIKPHNLMLTPEGHLVITDFGLARFLSAPSITVSGEMMGTPAYMSPEQVRAEQQAIDHRTDIYSLGIALYEMLALEVPFRADTREALLRQILMKDPPPLRRINPRIPRDLETICAKAIEKDPDRRYRSAELFAHDLNCFLEGLPITARPIGPVGRVYRRALRRKALTAALAGLFLALIVGAFFGVQSYRASVLRAEAERRAGAEAVAKREEERWRLLAEARTFLEERRYDDCLSKLREVASIRDDHALRLCMWALARRSRRFATPKSTWKTDSVNTIAIAFSPDGKILASASRDNTVRLWEVATGRQLGTFSAHLAGVRCIALSADGKTLASGSGIGRREAEGDIKLWDVATGRELRTLTGHTSVVQSVAFSPDGKTLASGSSDDTIKLWEVATGRELRTLTGHTESVMSVTFSPDGKTLASASWDETVKLWDVATGREFRTLTGHTGLVDSVAFSPDGKTLASGSRDNRVKVWEVATGRALLTITGHTGEMLSVAFSPDGKTLASGSRASVELWELHTEEEVLRLRRDAHRPASIIVFSPGGRWLASASDKGEIELWDAQAGGEPRTLAVHDGKLSSLAFSPDGKTLASGTFDDSTIKVWDVTTGRELQSLVGHTLWVSSVAFSPDGRALASGSGDKTIKVWEAVTGTQLMTLRGHASFVNSVAFSPDGKTLASGSADNDIKLWDVTKGTELWTATPLLTRTVSSVAFSPDGQTIASIILADRSEMSFSFWDVATGERRIEVGAYGGKDACFAFNPDGTTFASSDSDGGITIWDAATGKQVIAIRPEGAVHSVAFAPDGGRLACGLGKDVVIYDFHAFDDDVERCLREAVVGAKWVQPPDRSPREPLH